MNLSSTGGGPCQLHFSMGGEGITFDKQILSGDYLISLAVLSIVLPFLSVCTGIAGGLFSPIRPCYCKLKSGMHGILSRRSVSNSRGAGDSRRRERKREIARQRERERKKEVFEITFQTEFLFLQCGRLIFFREMIEGFSPSNLVQGFIMLSVIEGGL